MNYDQTEKFIRDEVKTICDEISSICDDLCCEHDHAFVSLYPDHGSCISDDEFGFATDDRRDKLCKRVKALGEMAERYMAFYPRGLM